jgi:hypothetical protein
MVKMGRMTSYSSSKPIVCLGGTVEMVETEPKEKMVKKGGYVEITVNERGMDLLKYLDPVNV